MRTLLIATHNPGKIREYRALLHDLPLELTWLNAAGITTDLPETGDTFAANAILKATGYAQLTSLWTWADDSGLEVDALDGRPGVLSARYGGAGRTDRERYMLLLEELHGVPPAQRTARFRCVVALAEPSGHVLTVEGHVEGLITDAPRGSHGFGYDPIFFLPAYNATMAELDESLKNQISHRAVAAQLARRILVTRLGELVEPAA